MRMPVALPGVKREGRYVDFPRDRGAGRLSPQGCNIFKKAACAAAVAGCIATPNPVACILAVAPGCVDCL